MARSADDLALALGILAGPDALQQAAWRVQLPAPRGRSLKDFRVAMWGSAPEAPIDDSVATLFAATVEAVRKAGAAIDESARPVELDENHRLFMRLLRAATAGRLTDEAYAEQVKLAEALTPDDMSPRAHVARGATLSHREWGRANEARSKLRYVWREFFRRFDVLLAPVAATAAFPHDHNPDMGARRIIINGEPHPHVDITWAGLAALSYLPATAAPIGRTASGLPVGLQIIGPEGEDPTTIEFARLLAREIGGFTPPPGYE
jgi:amidase